MVGIANTVTVETLATKFNGLSEDVRMVIYISVMMGVALFGTAIMWGFTNFWSIPVWLGVCTFLGYHTSLFLAGVVDENAK